MLTDFSVLATTFLVATILIPFGTAVLIYGFFSRRKRVAWLGFSSIALAIPVLLVVIFIGVVRGLNTAVNVASNRGGELIQDLQKRVPPADEPADNVDNPATPGTQPGTVKRGDEPTTERPAPAAGIGWQLRLRSMYDRLLRGESASIVMAREFAEKGVRFGTVETRPATKDQQFRVSVYMIFDGDYTGPVRMRALDADGREMGRVNITLNETRGAARYVDFQFDARFNSEKFRYGVLDAPGFQDPFPGR